MPFAGTFVATTALRVTMALLQASPPTRPQAISVLARRSAITQLIELALPLTMGTTTNESPPRPVEARILEAGYVATLPDGSGRFIAVAYPSNSFPRRRAVSDVTRSMTTAQLASRALELNPSVPWLAVMHVRVAWRPWELLVDVEPADVVVRSRTASNSAALVEALRQTLTAQSGYRLISFDCAHLSFNVRNGVPIVLAMRLRFSPRGLLLIGEPRLDQHAGTGPVSGDWPMPDEGAANPQSSTVVVVPFSLTNAIAGEYLGARSLRIAPSVLLTAASVSSIPQGVRLEAQLQEQSGVTGTARFDWRGSDLVLASGQVSNVNCGSVAGPKCATSRVVSTLAIQSLLQHYQNRPLRPTRAEQFRVGAPGRATLVSVTTTRSAPVADAVVFSADFKVLGRVGGAP